MVHETALSFLGQQIDRLPGPYLITGPHAAYLHHRWLQPIEKMVDVSIPPDQLDLWRAAFGQDWTILTQPPSAAQMRSAKRLLMIETTLTQKRFARRIMRKGLAFLSAEDVCLDLLQNAQTQIGLSEIAALLIKQGAALDIAYLRSEMGAAGPAFRLAEIIGDINAAAGRILIDRRKFGTPTDALLSRRPSLQKESLAELLRPLRAHWEFVNAIAA